MQMDEREEKLLSFLEETRYEDLPPEAVEGAKRCILDTVGVMAAGAHAPDIDKLIACRQGRGGREEIRVFGREERLSAFDAVWVACAMTRANEMDDSHDPSGEHVSTPILGAGLAEAQQLGKVSGKDFIRAYALAAEIVPRIRRCPVRDGMPFFGFAANSYAPFSAAVMCASLRGLKGEALYHTLGWAYAQMAGAVQLQQGGGSALYIHHGLAAATGYRAAELAALGFPGTDNFLLGRFGVLNAYERGNYDLAPLTDGLGQKYVVAEMGIKKYPSGRVTHTPIDAALTAREKLGSFNAEEVERVTVRYTRGGFAMTCLPDEDRHYPTRPQHARFSLYYTLASALLRGHVALEDFSCEAVNDEQIRSLIGKIHVEVDETLPMLLPGILSVRMKDGREVSAYEENMKGSAALPLSYEEIVEKAVKCFAFGRAGKNEAEVRILAGNIRHLEDFDDIVPLFFG